MKDLSGDQAQVKVNLLLALIKKNVRSYVGKVQWKESTVAITFFVRKSQDPYVLTMFNASENLPRHIFVGSRPEVFSTSVLYIYHPRF